MGDINSSRALNTLEDITLSNLTVEFTFMGKKRTYLCPVTVAGMKSMACQEQMVVTPIFKINSIWAATGGYFRN